MKIIDEKGRFFGKINVIDFLVILLVLCILPAFYLGYKIMTKKPVVGVAPKKEFIEVQIDCQLIKVKPEVAKIVSVGDKELDENREIVGEIVGLGQSAPYKYELDIGGGQKIVKEDAILKQMEAKVKLKTEVKQNNLYYKDVLIKIGSPLEFKTNKYSLAAIPFEEEEKKEKEERITDLTITLKGLDKDMLKEISVGDKEVDERGQTIAEILSLGKIENSTIEFNLGKGNFAAEGNPAERQISTKMRLKCQVKELKDDRELYFKGKKVEYNTPIEFKTDKYRVEGEVAKTYEITSPLKERWISLEVKFSGVFPEIANIVQKGDAEKDPLEKTAARIISIISNTPSEVLTLKENKFITLIHPFSKDLLLVLDVQCTEKEGIYYFKNYPVKMGNNITFATDLYSITGVIIGMGMK